MGSEGTVEEVETLLKEAAEESANPEVRYKINTARQLLLALE